MAKLGQPGSRDLIPTPALVCEVRLLDDNIARMAAIADRAGVSLRPHVKSHKSSYVARRQLEAGAVGLSFAKLGEAEAVVSDLSSSGHSSPVSALITSPLVGAQHARRAVALAHQCDLIVCVDHVDGVRELAAAVATSDVTIGVVCDVDVGLGRTGVTGPEPALSLLELIDQAPALSFQGVQGYGGHLQHIASRDERQSQTKGAMQRLTAVIEAIEETGHDVALRTGGGTGTCLIDVELGVLNELQVGSYVFMDREYRDALGSTDEGAFAQSLRVCTTVISDNQTGFVTVDAGLKALATDAGDPLVLEHPEVTYMFFGDEHGLVTRGGDTAIERGCRLELVPPHCDPTVDRYDVMWLVDGDVAIAPLDVVGRGCSQ